MFVLREAVPGEYRIAAVSFAADALRASTRTRALVTVREDWGRENARTARHVLTLSEKGESSPVATVRR